MTNKVDNLKNREDIIGDGAEETLGIATEGFSDPSGEYPRRDYFFATSINKAAKGEKVNNLALGGGDYRVSLNLSDQKPSEYPYNQVQETISGHAIEIDDTPGGERILIKHRTGAGVELRADGTVIVSSITQKIEVTGGDQITIVEGEGNLVYKGNLNLQVSGDFNVDVQGNYNLNVAGDKIEEIKGRHTKTVNKDQNYTIRGARGSQVVGMVTETCLDDYNIIVSGKMNQFVQGNLELLSGAQLITTAVSEWVAASATANITARHISMIGHKGTIGGPLIDYYGKTYGGFPGAVTNISTFYGTLVGKATEALHADYAISSSFAQVATQALESLITGKEVGGVSISPVTPKVGIMPYLPLTPSAPIPIPPIVELQLCSSNYGIRNVAVDPKLKEKILKTDDYKNLFNHNPTIEEIRSKLRDKSNFDNGGFTSFLVAEGKLNKDFKKNIPKNIGRSANKQGSIHFGLTMLGNNAIENRSKRFKVNKK
jgi:hypothetical protein